MVDEETLAELAVRGGPVQELVQSWACAVCGLRVECDGPRVDQRPEGFWLNLYKVTAGGLHWIVPETFVCDKDCLVKFAQYHISDNQVEPIGGNRPTRIARPIDANRD